MRIVPLSQGRVAQAVAGLRPSPEHDRSVSRTVAALCADVRSRGDAALVDVTRGLDWPGATIEALRLPAADLAAAFATVDPALLEALSVARENLTWFHRHERRPDWEAEGPYGQRLGIRYRPVARAGMYVPGGLGAYASTVIMNAVPAQVAGVGEVFVCTPPDRDGRVNPSVLAAVRFMGIEEVYRVGGAQAVAAMAFGTATIRRADVICGPGNAYVMEAKRQVYGEVGIDGLAGPSEVVVVAEAGAMPEAGELPTWVAADLLAQEEHGSGASAVLLAENEDLCRAVAAAVADLRARATVLGRQPVPPGGGDPPVVGDRLAVFHPAPGEDFLELAAAFVNEYAPEHLELHLEDARGFLARVRSAGAFFLGSRTPTAFGDYVAGSNHVLPTGGSARFSSPLSVDTFLRASSIVELSSAAVRALAPHLARLADSEGFGFHRVSAELRVRSTGDGQEI